MPPKTRLVVVGSRDGLHARPCAAIAAAVKKSKCSLRIRRGATEVDGASIFGLLTLVAGGSARLELIADGEAADRLLDEVAAIVEAKE
jgi:phosphotransferase system HPr (HPr) family protein